MLASISTLRMSIIDRISQSEHKNSTFFVSVGFQELFQCLRVFDGLSLES